MLASLNYGHAGKPALALPALIIMASIGGDLCKTPTFAQSLCQIQILILKILNVFLRLKFSSSLTLNKIERFSKVSEGEKILTCNL